MEFCLGAKNIWEERGYSVNQKKKLIYVTLWFLNFWAAWIWNNMHVFTFFFLDSNATTEHTNDIIVISWLLS